MANDPASPPGLPGRVVGSGLRWEYLAAGWCGVFAVVHLYWACGGDTGLASSAGVDLATHRPTWFVIVGLWGAALLLLVGVALCLGLGRDAFTGRAHRAGWVLCRLAGAVLVIRAIVVHTVLLADAGGVTGTVGPTQTFWSLWLWDPWFLIGGVLLLIAAHHRHTPRGHPLPT
jgi:Protein of unknown function (DUF3995)